MTLTVALPTGQDHPSDSAFPLAPLWEFLTTRPAWSLPSPTTPQQEVGGAANRSAMAADRSKGTAGGPAPAGSDYKLPPASDTPEVNSGQAIVGFSAATSKRMPNLSSAHVDVFHNVDGTITERSYETPVNYQAADGSWQPIDRSLTRAPSGRVETKAGPFKVSMAGGPISNGGSAEPELAVAAAGPATDLVSITLPTGESISYGLAGAANVAAITGEYTATYRNILPATDLELRMLASGYKESLILANAQAATEWLFPLRLNGLSMRLDNDGSVVVLNAAGVKVLDVPHGFMEDSNRNPSSGEGVSSENVTFELVSTGEGQALKVVADRAWIRDPARVFPIVVDPSVGNYATVSTYVHDNDKVDNWAKPYMKTGRSATGVNARGFVKFFDFSNPNVHLGKRVLAANLVLNVMWAGDCTTSTVRVHDVDPWDPLAMTTWSTAPALQGAMGVDTQDPSNLACVENDENNPEIGDQRVIPLAINVVNRWTGGGANNGVALAGSLAVTRTEWSWISSSMSVSKKPRLDISYVDNVPPAISRVFPPHGYQSPTLTPELLVDATDADSWPNPLTYRYTVTDDSGTTVDTSDGWTGPSYKVKPDKLKWGKAYFWQVEARDGVKSALSQPQIFIPAVLQPLITSSLSQNSSAQGFEPKVGNYTTAATDAEVGTVGPGLSIQRYYNSRDPRTGQGFGAGWSSIVDARAELAGDRLTFTYPSGQQITFGKQGAVFAPPGGSAATTVTVDTDVITLVDGGKDKYVFGANLGNGVYGLTSITDPQGRALQLDWLSGRVDRLTSLASGRKLQLTWAAGRVTKVANDLGEEWTYTYSGTQLTKVCTPVSIISCSAYTYGTATSLYPAAVLDTAPRSYLRLGEQAGAGGAVSSALDSLDAGAGRYGPMGVVASSGLPGSSATAAGFNGSSSFVEFSRSPSLFGAAQSVSLRFKTSGPGVLYALHAGSLTAPAKSAPVLYVGTDGKIHGKFPNGQTETQQLVSGSTVTDNVWHQVTLTSDGQTQRLFVDGVETGTAQVSPVSMPWATTGFVGAGNWLVAPNVQYPQTTGTMGYFSGQIADIAHWTRELAGKHVQSMWQTSQAPTSLITKVARPSGVAEAKIEYDAVTGIVTKVTDANNGAWQIGASSRSGSGQSFAAAVLAAGPQDYFRLANAANEISAGTITANQVTFGVDGGPLGPDQDVSRFNGTSSYVELPNTNVVRTGPATVSLWFRLPAGNTSGGVLYSYQSGPLADTAQSAGWVPSLYVGTDGKLRGLFWAGEVNPITSTAPVNDGQWHLATLTASTSEQKLFLDGNQVGSINRPLSSGVAQPGNTFLGAGKWSGWPVAGSNTVGYWPGDIAEYAHFKRQLSNAEVFSLFTARDQARQFQQLPKSNILTSGPGTVSAWFQLPAGSNSGGVIYSHQSAPVTDPTGGDFNPALYVGLDGKLRGYFWMGNDSSAITTAAVNDGQWHHVVLTASASSQTLFLDGVAVGSVSGSITPRGTEHAYLGRGTWTGRASTGGTTGQWPGSISGFIFDTAQWTPASVTAAFQAGRGTAEPEIASAGSPVKTVVVKDPNGQDITNVYEIASGRQIEVSNAEHAKTRFGYDPNGFLRTITDPNGNRTVDEHDLRGNVTSRTTCQYQALDPLQGKCSTTWFDYYTEAETGSASSLLNDKLEWINDPRSSGATDTRFRTTYKYDAFGNIVETIDALGRSSKAAYTDGKTILADIDVSGSGRYLRMNGTKRGTSGGFSLWEFEAYGPENRNLALGRPVTVSSTSGTTHVKDRAADGDPATRWLSASTDNEWITIDLGQSYNLRRVKLLWEAAFGREYRVEASADGTSWTTLKTFDAANPQSDALTPAGLISRTITPGGAIKTSTYNAKGDLVEEVDAAGLRARHSYDALGRTIRRTTISDTYSDGLTTTFSYSHNAVGRVMTVTEPPVLNRVKGPNATHTKKTTTQYNVDGQPIEVKAEDLTGGDASRTVTTEYNALGQPIAEVDPKGNRTQLEYDLFGRVVKQIAQDGTITETTFDVAGRQHKTIVNGGVLEWRYYDLGGRLTKITDAMQWRTEFDYSNNNLLLSTTRVGPGGATYVTERNEYDVAGNVIKKWTNNGVTLTEAVVDAASRPVSETVDPQGLNRRVSRVYGADDQVLSEVTSGVDGSSTVNATYDIAGRRLTSSVPMPGGAGAPAAWWKLSEVAGTVAADSAGAKPAGAVGGVTWSDGAANLDGDDHLITTGPVLDTTNSYTFSLWAKVAIADGFRTALSQDGTRRSGFLLTTNPNGTTWELHQYHNDADGATDDTWVLGQGSAVGQWAHIVGIYDKPAGKIRLRINGGAVTEASAIAGGPLAATSAFAIGRSKYNGTNGGLFKGAVANVQVYQRVLTADEITTLYSRGRSGVPISSNAITTTFEYNQLGQEISRTDPMGNKTRTAYDEAGNPVLFESPTVSTENNAGTVATGPLLMSAGFDTFGGQTESKDARGLVTTTTFDANGQAVQITSPSYLAPGATSPVNLVTKTSYNGVGRADWVEDSLGRKTYYQYNALGQITSVKTPDDGVTTTTYHANGRVASVTSPSGARTESTWDYLGRQATQTNLVRRSGQPTLALTTTMVYSSDAGCFNAAMPRPLACAGWQTGVTSPEAGRVSATPTYNRVGEVVSVRDAFNNTTSFGYDFAGRQILSTAPNGNKQTVSYDLAGRPAAQSRLNPNGALLSTISAVYDANSRPIATTDARGNTYTATYDAVGRTTQTTTPVSATESITESFGYDADGQLTRRTDGRGIVVRNTYNTWGLLESTIEPGGHTFTTVYDNAARVAEVRQPGGVNLTYGYNNMDEVTQVAGSGAEVSTADRTFGYDPDGKLTSVSGSGGTNTLTYDDRGLLTSVDGPSGASSFTWTNDGLMASRSDGAGTTSYTWDAAGRLATAANSNAGLNIAFAYNSVSQVSQLTYGTNQNRRVFGYDALDRVASDELKTAGGASIGKITYGYDLNGNLTSKTSTGFAGASANTYTYDRANRLMSWNNGASTVDYGWDKAGNRVKVGGRTYVYNDRNQLVSDTNGTTYAYSARGTLRSTTTGSVARATDSDAFGQVAKQYSSASAFTSYTYDGLGRVVNTGFVYSGTGNDLAADPTANYVRDPGGALIGSKVGSSAGSYTWTDLHTDVVAQFTASGSTLAGSQSFDPWGKALAQSGITGSLGYQSSWTDSSTGRVNMHARWYNPDNAAFDTRDSVSVPNRYSYTTANPMTQTDPSGHFREFVGGYNAATSADQSAEDEVKDSKGQAEQQRLFEELIASMRLPDANNDGKCRLGSSSSADCYEQNLKVTARCPHAPNATTLILSNCTEVSTGNGCYINGKPYVAASKYQCLVMAKEQDDNSKHFRDGDDPRVKEIADLAGMDNAYQVGAEAQAAEEERIAKAKCDASWACRNASWIGAVAGAIAGAVVGGVCLAATAGAGSVLCAAGAGFVGGFVGGLTTGFLQGKTGTALWGGALLDGAIGGVLGVLTLGLGVGLGALAKAGLKHIAGKAVGAAVTTGIRSAGNKVAASALGRAASAATRTVSNGMRSVTNAVEKRIGSNATRAVCEGASAGLEAALTAHSFDPATRVLMADGTTKPIGNVELGDKVKATDPETGITTAEPVTKLHINQDPDLADVTVQDTSTGETTVLHTTWHHPFWNATDRQWTEAKDLIPGTRLRDDEGKETQQVVSVRTWTGLQEMRDLTVDTVHTYYVMAADTPVLVHNCGGSYKSPKDAGHHLTYELRDADGNMKVGGSLWSGNMTPEEASIKGGWNQQAVTHTENRLMRMFGLPSKHNIPKDPYFGLLREVDIREGDVLHLWGELDPCNRCKNVMAEFMEGMGADIKYHGPSGTWP